MRLVEGPVVRCERSGQGHLTDRNDEVHHPEEHEQLEELQVDCVPERRGRDAPLYMIYQSILKRTTLDNHRQLRN